MRALVATVALVAVTVPAAPATAVCTNDFCAVECALYVVRHFDPHHPSLVCPL